jgi:hypothetical protein
VADSELDAMAPSMVPPTASLRGRRRILLGGGSALVALALILAFALVLAPRFSLPNTAAAPATATQTPPAGWHLYHDPDGYFTIALPPGWQVVRDTGSGQEGDASSAAEVRTVSTELLPPGATPPEKNPDNTAVGLRVSITFDVYTNLSGDYKHKALCSVFQHANTHLNGYPAQQLNPNRSWLFATSAATYQVSYSLPGDLPGTLITTLPTPVPQATRTTAESQALAIIHTLRLNPATPPKC